MAAPSESEILTRPEPLFSWENLIFPLLGVVLLLSVVVGFNLLPQDREGSSEERELSGQQLPSNAIYQTEGDTTGRTLLYAKGGFFERSYFGGVGEQEREVGVTKPVKLPYLVGSFSSRGWEEAPGGYYVSLEDPQTGQALGERMKVPFEAQMALEDVTVPRPLNWLQQLGMVNEFTKAELEVLVRPGDAVVVELLRDGKEVVRDNGTLIVDHLIIRRVE